MKEYDILIKNGCLSEIGEIALKLSEKTKTFAIITDDNVQTLYEKTVAESLMNAGFSVISYAIPNGEKSKNAAQYFALLNWLAENQITRSDTVVALGGGVVGDLAGFTAATYLRGIPFYQVPTTVLAMVDSSVGGKTGIDIQAGKNLVGAFHQPQTVICDPETLKTLAPDVFSDGCAEVIKHGMIRSAGLLETLLDNGMENKISEVIEENVRIKMDIVQRDEFDTGERQLLNFGHSIAHAIEKLSGFELSHGSAVATGMCIITRAAVKKEICPPQALEILEKLTKKFNLPRITSYAPQAIYDSALSDKKRAGDTLTEVIPREAGVCELIKFPITELLNWIEMGVDA